MENKEIRILIVSDSHKEYTTLEEIIEKESNGIDMIIHSGDFANITEEEKHLEEIQQDGLEVYTKTINILKRLNKPIICVPGNVINT